jgi:lysozyme
MPVPNNHITSPVGDPKQRAANRSEDVKTVQGLLNVQIIKDHRSDRLLRITGNLDGDTLKAIIELQRRQGIARSGLIEPRDGTFSALLKFSGPHHMHVSQSMIDQIKATEQLKLHPYATDGSNTATIGFGHRLHPGLITDADRKKFKNGITETAANDLLREDLRMAERRVHDHVDVPLTQHQFDALVSFAFNLKGDAFRDSTLLKMLNGSSGYHTGDYLETAKQFDRWIYVRPPHRDPVLSRGLSHRRAKEKAVFLNR